MDIIIDNSIDLLNIHNEVKKIANKELKQLKENEHIYNEIIKKSLIPCKNTFYTNI